jgi:hypothetical protein
VLHPCRLVAACRRDDVAFGDQFHLVAQGWRGLECRAQDRLGGVAAINIGLIECRDALGQTGFDLGLDMGRRGVGVVANAPHAIDDAAHLQRIVEFDAFH